MGIIDTSAGHAFIEPIITVCRAASPSGARQND